VLFHCERKIPEKRRRARNVWIETYEWVSDKKGGKTCVSSSLGSDVTDRIGSDANGWNKITVLPETSRGEQASVQQQAATSRARDSRRGVRVLTCVHLRRMVVLQFRLLFLLGSGVTRDAEKVHYAECRFYHSTSPFARICSFPPCCASRERSRNSLRVATKETLPLSVRWTIRCIGPVRESNLSCRGRASAPFSLSLSCTNAS